MGRTLCVFEDICARNPLPGMKLLLPRFSSCDSILAIQAMPQNKDLVDLKYVQGY
jgi:hypothetical protein